MVYKNSLVDLRKLKNNIKECFLLDLEKNSMVIVVIVLAEVGVLFADSSNNDQVGKSVAIIVGVFGGLAVLVVLLSICKKAAGKHFPSNLYYEMNMIRR